MSDERLQPDCTPRCKSQLHGRQLVAAVTRGTTEQIKAYCRTLCHNFFSVSDRLGKNALHVAASCGKWEIVEWILENYVVHVDTRDGESGWTALHRSLFYGQLASASLLLKHKANLRITDHDGLNPLELAMLDRLPYIEYLPTNPCEVYVWGSNSNFNLGLEKQQSRENPELLEAFRRENVSIKQVIMRKFHSVFLSHDGRVFTCGLGRGGRLGQNMEGACLVPTPVQSLGALCCEMVASGQDHLVLLMENSQIWTCGTNTYHQLGHVPPPEHLMTPRPLNLKFLKGKNIVGICAARYHSVFYTEDALFTFGLNAGQLGHPKGDKFQSNPRQVSSLNEKSFKLTHVAVSDGATVCATSKGDVIVQHEYQCRKIASRQLEIKKLSVLGGHLNPAYMHGVKESGDLELRIIILTLSGKIYIWRENNPVLTRCLFSIGRELTITDLDLNHFSVVLLTSHGEGFVGSIVPHKERHTSTSESVQSGQSSNSSKMVTTFVPLLEKDECDIIRVKRIPYIHRAVSVSCDSKGRNFAVLQGHPKTGLLDLPSLPPSTIEKDFTTLLEETCQFDLLHDIVVRVENREYLAHKYILAYRSEYFRKQLQMVDPSAGGVSEISIEYVTSEAFEKVLQFIYCNICDMLIDGKAIKWKKAHFIPNENTIRNEDSTDYGLKNSNSKSKKKKNSKAKMVSTENNSASTDNPISEVQDASRRLGVSTLTKCLSSVKLSGGKIKVSEYSPLPKLKFDRHKLTNLCDVTLKSEDGKEFLCHKCILTARLDYFKSMLCSGWIETSTTKALQLPIPSAILDIVLDFLYTDQAPKLFSYEDAEFVCQILVIADQLLITKLKQMCEVALVDMITLKNVSELLELSYIYNATQLKSSCMQYICINLPAILEGGGFEILSNETLVDLTSAYRNLIPRMARRVITPYSTGPTDEEFDNCVKQMFYEDTLPVSITPNVVEKAKGKRRSLPRRISSSSDQEARSRKTSCSEGATYPPAAISPSLKPDDNCPSSPEVLLPSSPIPSPSPSSSGDSISHQATLKNQQKYDKAAARNKGSWTITRKVIAAPSLRDIMIEEEHKDQKDKSIGDTKRSPRVTSKQWKKLPLTTVAQTVVASPVGHTSPPITTIVSPSCPWGNMPSIQPQSFWNAVKTDNFASSLASNVFSSPPKGLITQATPPRLGDILRAEETEQKNMAKYKAKPLHLIHVEDQAIEELLKYYDALDNPDEKITVQRVLPDNVAAPVWKKHASLLK